MTPPPRSRSSRPDAAPVAPAPPRLAWRPVLLLAGALALVHGVASAWYGAFGDELYFIAAGRHLAWGYADQPPLVPWLAAALDHLAPGNLVVLRLPATLASAGHVVLAALLAGRWAGAAGRSSSPAPRSRSRRSSSPPATCWRPRRSTRSCGPCCSGWSCAGCAPATTCSCSPPARCSRSPCSTSSSSPPRRGPGRRRARGRAAPAARAPAALGRAGAGRGVHRADAALAVRARLAAAADGRGGRRRGRADRQPLVLPALRRLGRRARARPRARRARALGAAALRRAAALACDRDRVRRHHRGDDRRRGPPPTTSWAWPRSSSPPAPSRCRTGRPRVGGPGRSRCPPFIASALVVAVLSLPIGPVSYRVERGDFLTAGQVGWPSLTADTAAAYRSLPPDEQVAHHRARLLLLVRLGPRPLRARRRPARGVQRPPRATGSSARPRTRPPPRSSWARSAAPRVLPHDHAAAHARRPHGERRGQRRGPALALHPPGALVGAVAARSSTCVAGRAA